VIHQQGSGLGARVTAAALRPTSEDLQVGTPEDLEVDVATMEARVEAAHQTWALFVASALER
jgi:hypothetical protein